MGVAPRGCVERRLRDAKHAVVGTHPQLPRAVVEDLTDHVARQSVGGRVARELPVAQPKQAAPERADPDACRPRPGAATRSDGSPWRDPDETRRSVRPCSGRPCRRPTRSRWRRPDPRRARERRGARTRRRDRTSGAAVRRGATGRPSCRSTPIRSRSTRMVLMPCTLGPARLTRVPSKTNRSSSSALIHSRPFGAGKTEKTNPPDASPGSGTRVRTPSR